MAISPIRPESIPRAKSGKTQTVSPYREFAKSTVNEFADGGYLAAEVLEVPGPVMKVYGAISNAGYSRCIRPVLRGDRIFLIDTRRVKKWGSRYEERDSKWL